MPPTINLQLVEDRLLPVHLVNKVDSLEDGIQREKPWHRKAALLTAGGYSVSEIAEILDYGVEAVRAVQRTPWFQSEVTRCLEKAGGEDIVALFKSKVLNALNVECEILDNPQVSPAVRANIAKNQIERVFGKATQRIEVDSTVRSGDPVAEVEALEREVAALRNAQMGGPN